MCRRRYSLHVEKVTDKSCNDERQKLNVDCFIAVDYVKVILDTLPVKSLGHRKLSDLERNLVGIKLDYNINGSCKKKLEKLCVFPNFWSLVCLVHRQFDNCSK